jgi:aryl-alcohol dehydrogenase (NADP+)
VYRDLYWRNEEFATVGTIEPVARELGLAMTTLAVAWSLAQPALTSVIIGASRAEQLGSSIAATEVVLDDGVLRELDRVTTQHLDGHPICRSLATRGGSQR